MCALWGDSDQITGWQEVALDRDYMEAGGEDGKRWHWIATTRRQEERMARGGIGCSRPYTLDVVVLTPLGM